MTVAYGWQNAFSGASSKCEVFGSNNARDLSGLDQSAKSKLNKADGADRNHGICSGITGAWIVGFCNRREEASDTSQFKSYFNNVLRFQGAYMKDVGGRTDKHIDLMANKANFDPNIKKLSEKRTSFVSIASFPSGRWAAYAAIWHHAIGIGGGDGFFVMDPNFGLYQYDSAGTFVRDFRQLVEARRKSKNKGPADTITLFSYR